MTHWAGFFCFNNPGFFQPCLEDGVQRAGEGEHALVRARLCEGERGARLLPQLAQQLLLGAEQILHLVGGQEQAQVDGGGAVDGSGGRRRVHGTAEVAAVEWAASELGRRLVPAGVVAQATHGRHGGCSEEDVCASRERLSQHHGLKAKGSINNSQG
jgi:hypothetical protein